MMIKHKYQLFFLCVACLAFTVISGKANAQQGQQQQIEKYNYGSAGYGWDSTGINKVNPDSDQPGRDPYAAANQNNLGDGTSQPEYTANVPGLPSYQAQAPQIISGPGSNLLAAPFQNGILPNTSQRPLTPVNPKLSLIPGANLPPTTLDSFVYTSTNAEAIYGDEGGLFPPMASNFSYISSGFDKKTREGLTTGHGSKLPSAWGGDEFHGNEHSMSGPNYASNPLSQFAPALNIPTN